MKQKRSSSHCSLPSEYTSPWEHLIAHHGPEIKSFREGQVYVLYFVDHQWQGNVFLTDTMTDIMKTYPNAQILGMSALPQRAALERYLRKMMRKDPSTQHHVLPDFYLDYMNGFRKWLATTVGMDDFDAPAVVIVNKSGEVAWRVQLGKTEKILNTEFERQLTHLLEA